MHCPPDGLLRLLDAAIVQQWKLLQLRLVGWNWVWVECHNNGAWRTAALRKWATSPIATSHLHANRFQLRPG